MAPALPNLLLPGVVVDLDPGLEAGLARWHEHWHLAPAQAKMHDPTRALWVTMAALKSGVVFEPGVMGTTEPPPAPGQSVQHAGGKDGALWPTGRQTAIQGDTIGDLDFGALAAKETFWMFWAYESAVLARKFFKEWFGWVSRSCPAVAGLWWLWLGC